MNDRDPFYSLYFPSRPLEKTPYQLDLEVKDRKPDIVPKAGDKVKIKSREWYEKWKNSDGKVTGLGSHVFLPCMSEHCGKTFEIKYVFGNFFVLKDLSKGWAMTMFEEVYPQELSTGDGFAKASDAIGSFIGGLGKGSSVTSDIFALNSVQEIGIATDWSKIVSDTAARITLPQPHLFDRPGSDYQIFLGKKEPELQTIKKHRFIKLENL